jgi:hypothetical protein
MGGPLQRRTLKVDSFRAASAAGRLSSGGPLQPRRACPPPSRRCITLHPP